MSKSSPAFQFYPGDWLTSQRVTLMTLEEEGAYIRALAYCWASGGIPADPAELARLIGKGGSTTVATKVQAMFEPSVDGKTMRHARLDEERAKQAAWAAKSAAGGKKSAQIRAESKGGSTTVPRVVEGCLENGSNQNSTLQSSSSSSISTPLPPTGGELAPPAETVKEQAGKTPNPSNEADVEFLHEEFCLATQKKFKLTADAATLWRKVIRERYTVADVLVVVRHLTHLNRGREDKRYHAKIDLTLFRNLAKFDSTLQEARAWSRNLQRPATAAEQALAVLRPVMVNDQPGPDTAQTATQVIQQLVPPPIHV